MYCMYKNNHKINKKNRQELYYIKQHDRSFVSGALNKTKITSNSRWVYYELQQIQFYRQAIKALHKYSSNNSIDSTNIDSLLWLAITQIDTLFYHSPQETKNLITYSQYTT